MVRQAHCLGLHQREAPRVHFYGVSTPLIQLPLFLSLRLCRFLICKLPGQSLLFSYIILHPPPLRFHPPPTYLRPFDTFYDFLASLEISTLSLEAAYLDHETESQRA